jgi:hypothetical protein
MERGLWRDPLQRLQDPHRDADPAFGLESDHLVACSFFDLLDRETTQLTEVDL